jgi:Gamma-glutamyl cyclotransferase, AIG2-like
VIATTRSGSKSTALRALGADEVVDVSSAQWVNHVLEITHNNGVDAIIDQVGGPMLTDNIRCPRLRAERRSNRQDCAANVVRVDKPDEATTLFVYGSLLDPVRREEIIGRRIDTMPATLHDYELGRARYFYVRKSLGISTAGFLLLNLTPRDFQTLDLYEEIPRLYTREKVEAFDQSCNPVRCWVYLPTALTLTSNK